MSHRRRTAWFVAWLSATTGAASGCGSTSTSPSQPATPSTPSVLAPQTIVQAISAQTQLPIAGVSIVADGLHGAGTADGSLLVTADTAEVASRPASFQGSGYVTRQTEVRVPGPMAIVSLIPSGFDLTSFDQMFRVPQLLRWTSAPPLAIERRALQYFSAGANSEFASTDQMSDAEYASLVADLTWALPQLTGGVFNNFSSVSQQTSDSGTPVQLQNPGRITVARVVGLRAATGYDGYSRWQFAPDGTVTGGVLTLDRDWDRSASAFVRPLRAHELGHALGYNHVTARTSIMNATVTVLAPTPWDLDAAKIAFSRQPGNRSPDNDLAGVSTNAVHAPVWSPWIR